MSLAGIRHSLFIAVAHTDTCRKAEMTSEIKIPDVYDKTLNFLVGSGASVGAFPTLALGLKGDNDEKHTIESLATIFEDSGDERKTPLYMHYYKTCIRPAQTFSLDSITGDVTKQAVLENYEKLLQTILHILSKRKPLDRRCNVFTTNYDGCFALAADRLLQRGNIDFTINDGARGFSKRYLNPRNYNSYLCQTGIFERHSVSIPQINLINLHGSVYWKKDGPSIVVDYGIPDDNGLLDAPTEAALLPFSSALMNQAFKVADIPQVELGEDVSEEFWKAYKALPIVNPSKWKFHETVFEEQYYQMLRSLSFELEKPNSVLITFGFSFADEHILSLIKRSLSNPQLQVFVCCFDDSESERLSSEFKIYPNVECISIPGGQLNFTAFNQSVFCLPSTITTSIPEIVP
jgi:hypothetical protein